MEVIVPAYLPYCPGFPNLKYEGILEPVNPPRMVVSQIVVTADNALIPVCIMNPESEPIYACRPSRMKFSGNILPSK
jgi:hypothetical protein